MPRTYLSDTPMQNAANAAGISDAEIEARAQRMWPKTKFSWESAAWFHRVCAREDAAEWLLKRQGVALAAKRLALATEAA